MVQIDESEKQIVIMSEDVNQLGLRNFDLTAYTVDAGQVEYSATFTFSVLVTDPCETTELLVNPYLDIK